MYDVTTACDALEAAFGQQVSAVGSEIVHSPFSILNCKASAAWQSAAHVEAAPKKKEPKPPTP